MCYEVGDVIEWHTPCRNNQLKQHIGHVVQVVAAGTTPYWQWDSSPRNHESYLCKDSMSGETFWPRVKWIQEALCKS